MSKLTKIAILFLILLNLVLATFLYMGKPKRGNKKIPKEIIEHQLGFDESQKQQFQELIEVHRKMMKKTHREIRMNKKKLYENLAQEKPTMNDSISNEIAKSFKKIEALHFNHFMDIKNLCNEEQKEKFNQMIGEFESIFAPRRNRRRGPRHRN